MIPNNPFPPDDPFDLPPLREEDLFEDEQEEVDVFSTPSNRLINKNNSLELTESSQIHQIEFPDSLSSFLETNFQNPATDLVTKKFIESNLNMTSENQKQNKKRKYTKSKADGTKPKKAKTVTESDMSSMIPFQEFVRNTIDNFKYKNIIIITKAFQEKLFKYHNYYNNLNKNNIKEYTETLNKLFSIILSKDTYTNAFLSTVSQKRIELYKQNIFPLLEEESRIKLNNLFNTIRKIDILNDFEELKEHFSKETLNRFLLNLDRLNTKNENRKYVDLIKKTISLAQNYFSSLKHNTDSALKSNADSIVNSRMEDVEISKVINESLSQLPAHVKKFVTRNFPMLKEYKKLPKESTQEEMKLNQTRSTQAVELNQVINNTEKNKTLSSPQLLSNPIEQEIKESIQTELDSPSASIQQHSELSNESSVSKNQEQNQTNKRKSLNLILGPTQPKKARIVTESDISSLIPFQEFVQKQISSLENFGDILNRRKFQEKLFKYHCSYINSDSDKVKEYTDNLKKLFSLIFTKKSYINSFVSTIGITYFEFYKENIFPLLEEDVSIKLSNLFESEGRVDILNELEMLKKDFSKAKASQFLLNLDRLNNLKDKTKLKKVIILGQDYFASLKPSTDASVNLGKDIEISKIITESLSEFSPNIRNFVIREFPIIKYFETLYKESTKKEEGSGQAEPGSNEVSTKKRKNTEIEAEHKNEKKHKGNRVETSSPLPTSPLSLTSPPLPSSPPTLNSINQPNAPIAAPSSIILPTPPSLITMPPLPPSPKSQQSQDQQNFTSVQNVPSHSAVKQLNLSITNNQKSINKLKIPFKKFIKNQMGRLKEFKNLQIHFHNKINKYYDIIYNPTQPYNILNKKESFNKDIQSFLNFILSSDVYKNIFISSLPQHRVDFYRNQIAPILNEETQKLLLNALSLVNDQVDLEVNLHQMQNNFSKETLMQFFINLEKSYSLGNTQDNIVKRASAFFVHLKPFIDKERETSEFDLVNIFKISFLELPIHVKNFIEERFPILKTFDKEEMSDENQKELTDSSLNQTTLIPTPLQSPPAPSSPIEDSVDEVTQHLSEFKEFIEKQILYLKEKNIFCNKNKFHWNLHRHYTLIVSAPASGNAEKIKEFSDKLQELFTLIFESETYKKHFISIMEKSRIELYKDKIAPLLNEMTQKNLLEALKSESYEIDLAKDFRNMENSFTQATLTQFFKNLYALNNHYRLKYQKKLSSEKATKLFVGLRGKIDSLEGNSKQELASFYNTIFSSTLANLTDLEKEFVLKKFPIILQF